MEAAGPAAAVDPAMIVELFKKQQEQVEALTELLAARPTSTTKEGKLSEADEAHASAIRNMLTKASVNNDNWALHAKLSQPVLEESLRMASIVKSSGIQVEGSLADMGATQVDAMFPTDEAKVATLVSVFQCLGKLLKEGALFSGKTLLAGEAGSYKILSGTGLLDAEATKLLKAEGVNVDALKAKQAKAFTSEKRFRPEYGNTSWSNRAANTGSWNAAASRACYTCGKRGHMAAQCPGGPGKQRPDV